MSAPHSSFDKLRTRFFYAAALILSLSKDEGPRKPGRYTPAMVMPSMRRVGASVP